MWVQSVCQEDPLEEGMAAHSPIVAWRIPWGKAWRATSLGSQGVHVTKALAWLLE